MKRSLIGLAAIAGLVFLAMLAGRVSPALGFPTPDDPDGHEHVAGTVGDPEACGTYVRGAESTGYELGPAAYDYVVPSPLGFGGAGNAPDHHWLGDSGDDFAVFDMGRPVQLVDFFPAIDHGPVPEEALEATVYASNDLTQPESEWAVGDITTLFDQGFDAAWISDDWVSRWAFDTPYRYVAVHWGGPRALEDDGDVEVDAVCAPDTGPDCSELAASRGVLWPPNHKLRLLRVSGASDADGDAVTLEVRGVTQDEPLNGAADGNTAPDAAWAARPDEVRLRAERSGRGDGRVYRILVLASDPSGHACRGVALVGVPHDRGKGRTPVDSGPAVDSFGP